MATENPVCMKIYAIHFHEWKLKFKKPRVDICNTYDKLKMIQCASNSEEKFLNLDVIDHKFMIPGHKSYGGE